MDYHRKNKMGISGQLLQVSLLALLSVFFLFGLANSGLAATQWVSDPATCNMLDATNFPGQNCDPDRICGDSSGIAQCYNTASLLPPAVSATSNTLYSASYPNGGYILNCYAAKDGAAPFCDNSGAYWCNRSNTCYTTQQRDTTCTANTWATATCGACRSGFADCNGDAGVCEVQYNVTDYTSGTNNHYGVSCLLGDVRCDSGYYDCDATGVAVGNGCEAVRTGSCTTGGGLTGTWSCSIDVGGSCTDGGSNYTCTCVPPKQYFETGTEAQYATTDPLLWGVQFGAGDLIHFGNSANSDLFVVKNDGSVNLGQIAVPADPTDSLYNIAGSLYWNGTMIGAGPSGSAWSLTGNASTDPAVNFIGTTDYQPIVFQTDSSEWMRLTEDGYLGVGIDNPEQGLSVKYDVLIGQNEDMIIPAGGIDRNLYLRARDGSLPGNQGTTNVVFQRNLDNLARISVNQSNTLLFQPYNLAWNTGMAMTNAGNVGIGINNPHSKLDIGEGMIPTPAGDMSILLSQDGGDSFLETASTDMAEGLIMHGSAGSGPAYDYGVVRQVASSGYANGWARGLHIYTGDNDGANPDPIMFSIEGNEVMRLTDSRNVGIRTSTPFAPLQVASDSGINTFFQIDDNSRGGVYIGNGGMYSGNEAGLYDAGGDYALAVYDASNDTVKLGHQITVDVTSGFIGMNESSPLAQLEITDFSSVDFEPLLLLSHGGAGQSVGFVPVGANPEGVVTAPRGSLAMDYNNGMLYINRDNATDWQSLMVGSSIWDGDTDTGIEVEETLDEDMLHLYTAGTERMRIEADGEVRINSDGNDTAFIQIGQGGHLGAVLSINGMPGYNGIVGFRDQDGEDVFSAIGRLADNNFQFLMGDSNGAYSNSYGGSTGIEINQAAEAIIFGRSEIRFEGNGSEYVGFLAPNTITTPTIWTLPAEDGTAGQALVTDGAGTLSWASGGSGWSLTGNAGINPALNFIGTTDAQPFIVKTDDTEAMRVDTGGNVSIGSTAANGRLYVYGSSTDPVIARFANTDVPDGFGFGADFYGGEAGLYEMLNGQLLVGHDLYDENILMLGQYLAYADQTTKNFSLNTTDLTHSLLVQGSTTTVGDNLFKVQGGTDGSYLSIYVPTGAERDTNIQWQRDLRFLPGSASSPAMIISNSSQVGIGTVGPDRLFHVETVDTVSSAITYAGRFSHTLSGLVLPPSAGFGTGLEFELQNRSSINRVAGTIENIWAVSNDGVEDSEMILKTMVDGTLAERMRIDDQGFVGIGTSAPLSKLTLAGNNSATDASLLRFLASNDSNIQSEIYFPSGGNATYWDVNSSGDGGALIIENYTSELAKFTNQGLIVNDGSESGVDFRVESDTDTHALFVDATNGYIGLDQSTPVAKLHIGSTSAGSAADYNYLQLQGVGDVQHKVYIPTGSNLMIWDFNGTGNGGAIEFRDYGTRIGMFTNSGLVINEGGVTGVGLRVAGDTQTHLLYTDATNDRVGIGTNTPGLRFHVVQASNAVAAFDRTTTDGTVVSIRQDGVEEGSISVTGTTVSYNAFTGSHYTWHEGTIEKGTLVSMTGKNKRLNDNEKSEVLYGVEVTKEINSPKVLGSYLSILESQEELSTTNPALVMAVGNGEVWVADKGANIEAGDYLISSDVAGHAQKMDTDYALNYVVARAAEDIDWSKVTETVDGVKHQMITVFFDSLVVNTQMVDVIKSNQMLGSRLNLAKMDKKEANEIKKQLGGGVSSSAASVGEGMQVGQATIPSKRSAVDVTFSKKYESAPIVMLTLASDSSLMRHFVSNVTSTGFRLNLYPTQYSDTLFNWQAYPSGNMQSGLGDEPLNLEDLPEYQVAAPVIEEEIFIPPASESTEELVDSSQETNEEIISDEAISESANIESGLEILSESADAASDAGTEEANTLQLEDAEDVLYNDALSIVEAGDELSEQIEEETPTVEEAPAVEEVPVVEELPVVEETPTP